MNQDNNFMDSRTLWAILLVGIVWFGWQQYINKKYGDQTQNKEAVVDSKNAQKVIPVAETISAVAEPQNPDKKISAAPEQKVSYVNPLFEL